MAPKENKDKMDSFLKMLALVLANLGRRVAMQAKVALVALVVTRGGFVILNVASREVRKAFSQATSDAGPKVENGLVGEPGLALWLIWCDCSGDKEK
jgi:hypothetical protein